VLMHIRLVSLFVAMVAAVATCGHPSTADATAAAPDVSARVHGVQLSRESMMYVIAQLTFVNHSTHPVRVTRYRVAWPSGRVEVTAKGLVVPASATLERTATIYPDAGDLDALIRDPAAATVVVLDAQ
jgi:hypothetical protein